MRQARKKALNLPRSAMNLGCGKNPYRSTVEAVHLQDTFEHPKDLMVQTESMSMR